MRLSLGPSQRRYTSLGQNSPILGIAGSLFQFASALSKRASRA
jgi:hypothetical protein